MSQFGGNLDEPNHDNNHSNKETNQSIYNQEKNLSKNSNYSKQKRQLYSAIQDSYPQNEKMHKK